MYNRTEKRREGEDYIKIFLLIKYFSYIIIKMFDFFYLCEKYNSLGGSLLRVKQVIGLNTNITKFKCNFLFSIFANIAKRTKEKLFEMGKHNIRTC